MTSQKSYNNLGKNVRDQLHKMRSAILLLVVLYLAVGPVVFLLQMMNIPNYSSLTIYVNLYIEYFRSFYFLAIAVGTVGGFYATRYQNVPQQSNFYHSLPISREGLLSARVLALVLVQALLLLVVTVADIVMVLSTAARISGGLALNLSLSAGLHYCYIMLVFLLALAVSLFAGQLTANSVGQVLMTLVLHLTVPAFGVVMDAIVRVFNSTVNYLGICNKLIKFNIINCIEHLQSVDFQISNYNMALVSAEDAANFAPSNLLWDASTTIIYLLLTLVLIALSYAFYKKRAVEKAGDTLLYPLVGSVIKAVYVFLGGLVMGIFFWQGIEHSAVGLVLGALIAMIMVHLIAEMIYSMDVDGVRRHYASSIVGLAAALAVSMSFQTGLVDLDNYLPKTADVKGAVISYSDDSDGSIDTTSEVAQDTELIAKIMDAAAEFRDKRLEIVGDDAKDMPDFTYVSLYYNTALGQSARSYALPVSDVQEIMKPLLNDGKFNEGNWQSLMNAKVDDLTQMSISTAFGDSITGYETYLVNTVYDDSGVSKRVVDEKDGAARAKALLAAVQSDLPKRNYEVLSGRVVALISYSCSSASFNSYGGSYFFSVYEGDEATLTLLNQWREEGYLPDERTQLNEMLQKYVAYVCDSSSGEKLGTLSSEDFIEAYLAGTLVTEVQMRNYGVEVEENRYINLCLEDGEQFAWATLYQRRGTELSYMVE